jgi:response regulator of citrate/malate metabolism|tara:strand:- start:325 stop:534 length:210 start_codon:yes stop_codon:yes gene_type:complete
MSNKLLQAALSKYEANRDEALAILDVYLNNSVGIGEHSNLLEEVTKWTEALTEAEENIETLNRHFNNGE